ncbi:DoxX family protein [Pleionea sediminis]|uniref:DoxX family protein n=1 Tax=Pleionea sediminis TaxID=2569479 RepID=UPI001FE525CA|nr:DoxX family protein [Pleionea sediminis]
MKPLIYILGLIYTASGCAKLLGLGFELEAFARWGYPIYFMYFIGVCEVLGGLALIINILRHLAALGLSLLMCGALITHAINSEWVMLLVATIILVLTSWLTATLWKTVFKGAEKPEI